MALGEDDRALADLNQAAKLNNSKDLLTLVSFSWRSVNVCCLPVMNEIV